MRILAIETSCDETAVAVIEGTGDIGSASLSVLGNALYSQADKHAEYGGVYPSLAKREHQANLVPLATEALKQADASSGPKGPSAITAEHFLLKIRDEAFRTDVENFLKTHPNPGIDMVAVTHGPGLEPALWTGINFGEAIASAWNIPALGIDHMEGHIVSALLKQEGEKKFSIAPFQFPLLALLISGGHTELVLMKEWFSYEAVGRTKDDSVGEAYDKVARLLDFAYPGGPKIEEAAASSRAKGGTDILFPRPMMHDDTCDFSFSGLKTAVLYKLRGMEQISEEDKEQIAQAFEDSARDVLAEKTSRALVATHPGALAVGGGVSANSEIRKALEAAAAKHSSETKLFFPDGALSGDNAIMIGAAAYLRFLSGKESPSELSALGNLHLED